MQGPHPLAAQATPGPAQPPHAPRGAMGVPYPDPRSAAAVPRPAAGRAPAPQQSRATVAAVARHAAPEARGRPVAASPPPPAHPDLFVRSTAPPRTRWPLLADDLFRLAHHDTTGRPLLHASVAGLGLAAALLAELAFTDAIVIENGQVCVVSRTPPPDVLAHTVLGQLAGEVAGHTVRTWLAFLSQTSHEQVALRLLRSGHVRVETARRLLARSTTYVPTESHVAAWPWARLSTRLRQGKPLDRFDTVLAGLMVATDLHRRVLDGAPGHVFAGLRQMVAVAPPSLRLLLSHTEAAVGDAVLTGHKTPSQHM